MYGSRCAIAPTWTTRMTRQLRRTQPRCTDASPWPPVPGMGCRQGLAPRRCPDAGSSDHRHRTCCTPTTHPTDSTGNQCFCCARKPGCCKPALHALSRCMASLNSSHVPGPPGLGKSGRHHSAPCMVSRQTNRTSRSLSSPPLCMLGCEGCKVSSLALDHRILCPRWLPSVQSNVGAPYAHCRALCKNPKSSRGPKRSRLLAGACRAEYRKSGNFANLLRTGCHPACPQR
mmetsp:Transcript_87796/g.160683  ORF Transcript_87796/g.160683 Transcript_87796/m.160683 type:complete len:230 (+) Transcript_87796:1941-2630(+)